MSESPGELSLPPSSGSVALAELYADDRREHADVPPVGTPEYRALRERDQRRRERAEELLASLEASGAARPRISTAQRGSSTTATSRQRPGGRTSWPARRRSAATGPPAGWRRPPTTAGACTKGAPDRRGNKILTAVEVRAKFGVDPELIPDYLALVGDSADGYPGIRGIGPKTAAQLLNRYGPLETFPPDVLPEHRDLALRFKDLATLRTDEPLFRDVDELRWSGPTADLTSWADRIDDPKLLQRCLRVANG